MSEQTMIIALAIIVTILGLFLIGVGLSVRGYEPMTAVNGGAASARPLVTLHYTNWCPHCTVMKPVFAAVKSRADLRAVGFAQVDEDVAHTPGITGYPTIILRSGGAQLRYPGGPDANVLAAWIKQNLNSRGVAAPAMQ